MLWQSQRQINDLVADVVGDAIPDPVWTGPMVSQRLDATLAIAVIPAIKRGPRDAEFVQRALGRQVDCSTSRMISAFSDAGYLMPRPPHLLPDR
ncbi:hypothetical protein ACVWZV_009379 [Bradyrhizobium sp. GM5.1]